MSWADVAWLVLGLALVGMALSDIAATLMVTWGSRSVWRPTRVFYRWSWPLWTAVARRLRSEDARERLLALYAPLSLMVLLTLWLSALLFGWAFVWMALRDDLRGAGDFGSLLYYSGVVLLTVGFGDITATGTAARILALVEAATGLATVALVISYLPSLYGAYGRRESRLLMLDHPSGERIVPASLVVLHAPDGDIDRLYRFFAEWEEWTADVLESHTAYPMLALFRSQHRGQSWITALGVVVDAAVVTLAVVPGAATREPFFMYRRGRRALSEISTRLCPHVEAEASLDRELWRHAYRQIADTGLPVRSEPQAWALLCEYRDTYGARLQALIDYLVAPPGFWGHSADGVLTEPESRRDVNAG